MTVRDWRPFGCTHCHGIVAAQTPYYQQRQWSCLAGLVIFIFGLTSWWLHLGPILITCLFFGSWIPLIAFRFLVNLWPQQLQLRRYDFRTQDDLEELAAILESVSTIQTWTPDLDRRLWKLDSTGSLDDWMEGAVTKSIECFKASLANKPWKSGVRAFAQLSFEKKRKELAAMAVDLRQYSNRPAH